MAEAGAFLSAYTTALISRRWSRATIARHQARLWQRKRVELRAVPAYAEVTGDALTDFQVTDIAAFRTRFDAFASGVTYTEAEALATAAETGVAQSPGLRAGFSTGTSGGTRGLFVTTPVERAAYMGQLLGKLLTPIELMRYRRVALCLRAPNDLYRSKRFDLRFFPLNGDADEIEAFDPEILIAPPQVLLKLRTLPSLRRVFYGAETLNVVERDGIAARLGVRPDPIYQATEGFLGAPCRLGTLHLNEDSLIVETEPLGDQGRFRPVVTDLRRRSQAVIRLRLDDILQDTVCACGSALRAVRPVEGRVQDIWRWGAQTVFPGEVEARVSPGLPSDQGWTATGRPNGIVFACAHDDDASAVAAALARFGQPVQRTAWDPAQGYPKRRHVRWMS
ncbi:cell division protein FtsA [Asticcacaulis sp. BYS171W]|uniref:Cell division protein FtsA n=1 Tax=Asticcacaulis aquaticus TaxID=2984212 RepID=A0ABT5HWZ6_9CAUL|nr:cell division protein FtsA [Asticcacaulis aquaticus]MDC7684597.1 cell division protein FtsA [Asticcacaulis aquaticus]